MIWDTGEYEVLPRHLSQKRDPDTDDEMSASSNSLGEKSTLREQSENAKLFQAFKEVTYSSFKVFDF